MIQFHAKRALFVLFCALGPLGNLLTPHFLPNAFRTYYFLLPLFPLFFITIREKLLKLGAIFLPFFIYCIASAVFVENFGEPDEPHILFRVFLLISQFFFALGAASTMRKEDEILYALKIYLISYAVSLFVGFCFYIGYYQNIVPLSLISRFSVLTQIGYGLLRFSPGSYPNEYGILSSFVLSLLTLMILEKRSKWGAIFLFFPTLIALILTTTRTAYVTYIIALAYLLTQSRKWLKAFTLFAIFFAIFTQLNTFQAKMGSLWERQIMWSESVEKAKEYPFWGAGFASLTDTHNVYFELIFELGFLGSLVLLASFFVSYIEGYFKPKESHTFLDKVRHIGLINVFVFALSNHNMNHHLTWFIFFLSIVSLKRQNLETAH